MSVFTDFVCWIIFIFVYPAKVMLNSYCSRISKFSWGNLLKKCNFTKFASRLKFCNKQIIEKIFSLEISQIFRTLILKHMSMIFSEPKNNSCKSNGGSGTPAISKMEFYITLVELMLHRAPS